MWPDVALALPLTSIIAEVVLTNFHIHPYLKGFEFTTDQPYFVERLDVCAVPFVSINNSLKTNDFFIPYAAS